MIRAEDKDPPAGIHIAGNAKGEETVLHRGREPGRTGGKGKGHRTARDSTSIGAKHHGPIDPKMPEMPPA